MDYKGTKLNLVKNINEDEMTAIMPMFGEIGTSDDFEKRRTMINGHDFGKEMIFLSQVGFKVIKVPINSVGGSIVHGWSMINAVNVARMNGSIIETDITGIADSMAGIFSAFGDRGKRKIANFGSGIVHEPLVQNENGDLVKIEELPDGELKTELLSMKKSLIQSLSSSTGKSEAEVKRVMKEGKRLTANEMKTFGMVDEVVKLSNETIEIENKTAIELMAACSNIEVNKKPKTMKKVNKLLNLSEDAAEDSAVKSIETLQNKVDTQGTSITEKDAEILKLKGEKKVLVDAAKETADKAAESFVDALINAGKLKKENRDPLIESAKKDIDAFKALTDSLEVTFVDVTTQLKKEDGDDEKDEKDAKAFHKHMVNGTVDKLEKEHPAKFKKLNDAYMNSNTNFDS